MKIQSIVRESIVDGPGLRYAVFLQGCSHHCAGCHNPQTHDPAGGNEISLRTLVEDLRRSIRENPLLDGVTLSGGEPMLQAKELLPFADVVHAAGLNLWLYTGYTLEEIAETNDEAWNALLSKVDTLVDGRFDQNRRTLETPFVGSNNQRVSSSPVLYIHTISFPEDRSIITSPAAAKAV
mgnify:CR=1 FL=1